jgi:hypothetical protein
MDDRTWIPPVATRRRPELAKGLPTALGWTFDLAGPSQRERTAPFTPCRQHPVKAASREAVARKRSLGGIAPVRPSHARQATPLPISESEPTVAPRAPVDVAAITPHYASDVLTGTPIENGLPGFEAEAEGPRRQ